MRLELGDELQLQFEYMGPTRERREASLQVPVALSELAVHLSTPATALVPLHPFELQVELTKLAALGGAAGGGRRVRLSLHRVPEGEEEDGRGRSTSAAHEMADEADDEPHPWLQNVPPAMLPSFVTAPASEAARARSCVLDTTSLGAVSSAPACAPFSLPSMGHYLALACLLEDSESAMNATHLLEDSESTPPAAGAAAAGAAAATAAERIEMCSGVLLGRTAAQWRASPLSEYLPRAVMPKLERTRYALGEAPRVRVTNPFQSAELRALLVWGNALAVRYLVSPALPPGGTTTHVQLPPLGDECKHGCTLDVTLIAASELGRRLPVPTSALFDETAPMLHRYSLELRVDAPPPPVQLELTVGSPVVAPGANASVTISLTDANGMPISGEVALVAVDAALLAVRPHAVESLGALRPTLVPQTFGHDDTFKWLLAPNGVAHVTAALQRLLALDPWLPVTWPSRPSGHHLWDRPSLVEEVSFVHGLLIAASDCLRLPLLIAPLDSRF